MSVLQRAEGSKSGRVAGLIYNEFRLKKMAPRHKGAWE